MEILRFGFSCFLCNADVGTYAARMSAVSFRDTVCVTATRDGPGKPPTYRHTEYVDIAAYGRKITVVTYYVGTFRSYFGVSFYVPSKFSTYCVTAPSWVRSHKRY